MVATPESPSRTPTVRLRLWALMQDYEHWTDYAPMVVEVQVQTPTKLTKQQKELLKEFDEQYDENQEEGFFARLLHGHFGQNDKKQQAGDA